MTHHDRNLIAADVGEHVELSGLGVRYMLEAAATNGRFSLVEHPLAPYSLGAPLHTHANEDEYSFILEGRFGVQIGEEVLEAGPGTLVLKPRGIPHSFWNASDKPARMLEIISPGGFEGYFREMSEVLSGPARDFGRAAEIAARYAIDIQLDSIGMLIARHGLRG